jgi:FKBP-type peptidyl-prolyl cis-trans isomerase 2
MRRLAILAAAAGLVLLPSLGARSEEAAAVQTARVADGKKVSIEYTLVLDDGKQADSNVGEPPLVYQHGASQVLPALEKELAGLAVGDTKHVTISPKDAYGDVDPTRVKQVAIDEIPEAARKVDAVLVGVDAEGRQMPVRVQKIDGEKATLDLNHPLAGRTLTFDVKIIAIE